MTTLLQNVLLPSWANHYPHASAVWCWVQSYFIRTGGERKTNSLKSTKSEPKLSKYKVSFSAPSLLKCSQNGIFKGKNVSCGKNSWHAFEKRNILCSFHRVLISAPASASLWTIPFSPGKAQLCLSPKANTLAHKNLEISRAAQSPAVFPLVLVISFSFPPVLSLRHPLSAIC